MSFLSRFWKARTSHKVGIIGALSSIIAIPLTIYLSTQEPSIKQTVTADNKGIAAGRDISIGKLVTEIDRNKKLSGAISSTRRKWKALDPLLVNYENSLKKLNEVSFYTAKSKLGLVTSATEGIRENLASFSKSVEETHQYGEGIPEVDDLLVETNLLKADVEIIESKYETIVTLAEDFFQATANVPTQRLDRDRVEELGRQRAEVLRQAINQVEKFSINHQKVKKLMKEIEKAQKS